MYAKPSTTKLSNWLDEDK